MHSKWKRYIALMLFCLSSLVFSANAYAGTYETGTARSGALMIRMVIDADETRSYYPREDIDFSLLIKNPGEEAWLRVRCDLEQTGMNTSVSGSCVRPGQGWKRIGNYIYYTEKAQKNGSYRAIESLRVPDVSYADNTAKLSITAAAEAISGNVITPDFNADDPWAGLSGEAVVNYESGSTGGNGGSGSGGSGGRGGTGIGAYSMGVTRYDAPRSGALVSDGVWELVDAENHLWKFKENRTGTFAADGWYYILNEYAKGGAKSQWFHFDKNGIMETGWLHQGEHDWYHLGEISDGELGVMTGGWYKDVQDQRWYYLDAVLGTMKTGWQRIGEKNYYFAALQDVSGPVWVYDLLANTNVGRWFYGKMGLRSFGSMYCNEKTPDGSTVNQDGEKIAVGI